MDRLDDVKQKYTDKTASVGPKVRHDVRRSQQSWRL